MTTFAGGSFDPEVVVAPRSIAPGTLCRAIDRRIGTKNLIADAIVYSAAKGEHDAVSLSDFALRTVCLGARDGE